MYDDYNDEGVIDTDDMTLTARLSEPSAATAAACFAPRQRTAFAAVTTNGRPAQIEIAVLI